ncbi:MAG: sugar ABC transporter substrate-binding protein [Alkalinema sp. RU_4_3]|nr:sugar ABC transporter substrate-binding protein [Alkalinema sp. RU_4_3]
MTDSRSLPLICTLRQGLLVSLGTAVLLGTLPGKASFALTTRPQTPFPANRPNLPAVPAELLNADGDSYVLGGGDRIRIDIFGVPEFSGEYQILPNGTISLPRVGSANVQGLTLRQATDRISRQYSNYLARPVITLNLLAGRPVRVALAGEVNRPGTYVVTVTGTANNAGEVPSLSRVLQMGEGPTQAADLRAIQVIRRRPGTNTVATYRVNFWQLMQEGALAQDLRLQDGDSVLLPPLTEINLADAQNASTASFIPRSNRPLRIAIVGEVNRPGPYTIADGQAPSARDRTETQNSQTPSVTQAIQVAGGITQLADLRNIEIKRRTRSGKEISTKVNFWDLIEKGDVLQDLPLQDGDRIEIGQAAAFNQAEFQGKAKSSLSPDRIAVNVVGEVTRPGAVSIPPNTPLNQALLSAGGFDNKRAKKSNVTLVRLEPNGSVSKRSVAVDFANDVNEKTNPVLRNGDTIIVDRSGLTKVTDGVGNIGGPLSGVFGILRLLGIVR